MTPTDWDWVSAERAAAAQAMLAELRAYRYPADWWRRAAAHCAARSGETVDQVLARWANGDPIPPPRQLPLKTTADPRRQKGKQP
jgi:hypothetical protein